MLPTVESSGLRLCAVLIGAFVMALAASAGQGGEKMVDVGGYGLQCRVSGEGLPAVVFLNGGSAPMDYWDEVAAEVAGEATVVTYERAGHGSSGMGREPRHGLNVARELRALLEALELPPPFVLVAHSAGCMYARVFVHEYPEDVSGMILLDPGDRDLLDDFGERRLEGADRERWAEYWDSTWARLAERADGFGAEIRQKDATIEQMTAAEFPPGLALYVVSALDRSRPHYYLADYGDAVVEDFYAFVQDHHRSLVRDLPRGEHVPVDDARHVIHQDRPDLVVSLIRSLLESAEDRGE